MFIGARPVLWGFTARSIQSTNFRTCHIHTNNHASSNEVNPTKGCHPIPSYASHDHFSLSLLQYPHFSVACTHRILVIYIYTCSVPFAVPWDRSIKTNPKHNWKKNIISYHSASLTICAVLYSRKANYNFFSTLVTDKSYLVDEKVFLSTYFGSFTVGKQVLHINKGKTANVKVRKSMKLVNYLVLSRKWKT
jgi:hypothetical protein